MPGFISKFSYYLYSIFELLFGFTDPFKIISIFLGSTGKDIKIIQLRSSSLQFKVRSPMDVWSLKETFLDRFYDVFGFPIQKNWTVIDIGAGLGEYTLFAAQQTDRQVIAFEPFPQSIILLNENIQLNNLKNIYAYQEAVSSKEGTLTLDLSSDEPLQFQGLNNGDTAKAKGISVSSRTLDDILTREGLTQVELIKLDCEGAEYEILLNAPDEVLRKIERFVMEYHDNVSQHDHFELAKYLEAHNFKVESFPNPVHHYLGYLRAQLRTTL